jgi:hypothetical protein
MTDARLWHLWLRINRVLRVMLQTRWSDPASRVVQLNNIEMRQFLEARPMRCAEG